VVFGDTNSTFAGALAASKLHIPVIHIEAGVRSFDRKMPEELNRIMIDHISDMLFCPTWNAACNIAIEGISTTRSYICGDVMVDLLKLRPANALQSIIYDNYYLLTIHREENNNFDKLKSIFAGLSGLNGDIIFPCHPKMRKYIESFDLQKNIHIIDPVGYFEMRELEEHAIRIITDSGGVQKEAYLLKVPCITLRENTEWVETLVGNWNILTGFKSNDIYNAFAINPDLDAYDPLVFGEFGVCKRVSNKIVEVLYG
jgi:UDP-N-acetylglucosamine 2-epimerase